MDEGDDFDRYADAPFLAKLTARDDSGSVPVYSWTEAEPSGGGYADAVPGRYGNATNDPLYELNGRAVAVTGAPVVEVRFRATQGGLPAFQFDGSGLAALGGSLTVGGMTLYPAGGAIDGTDAPATLVRAVTSTGVAVVRAAGSPGLAALAGIPATPTQTGVATNAAQRFGGVKDFYDGVVDVGYKSADAGNLNGLRVSANTPAESSADPYAVLQLYAAGAAPGGLGTPAGVRIGYAAAGSVETVRALRGDLQWDDAFQIRRAAGNGASYLRFGGVGMATKTSLLSDAVFVSFDENFARGETPTWRYGATDEDEWGGAVFSRGIVTSRGYGLRPIGAWGTNSAGDTVVDGRVTAFGAGGAYAAPAFGPDLDPNSGPVAGGTRVAIVGTGFRSGASVYINGVSATYVLVDTSRRILIDTPASATAGAKNVVVTNPDAQTATRTNGFTYVAPFALASISPTSGPAGGGTAVTITGTTFPATITGVTVGGAAATSVVRVSSTSVTAVTPAGTAGARDVAVTASGYTDTLTGAFTYVAPSYTVASISPASGPASGGQAVTITGTSYPATITGVTIGGAAATSVVRVSSTSITAVTPAGTAGARDVVVDATTGPVTLAASYTYVAAPTVSSISPTSGPEAGGTTVTLTGTFPAASTYTVTFGVASATSVVRVNGTTVTCVSPAGVGTQSVFLQDEWGQQDGGYGYTYVPGLPPPP